VKVLPFVDFAMLIDEAFASSFDSVDLLNEIFSLHIEICDAVKDDLS
jgi:hypothetical protein